MGGIIMAWNKCEIMDERIKFISRLLDGERMSELCREFNISRKTGYKFYNRYQTEGLEGFYDRSRKPLNVANRLAKDLELKIIELKQEYPTWGARKIRDRFNKRNPNIKLPALSTVHAVLDRNGLVKERKKRYRSQGTSLSNSLEPNDLWCADFKGQFKLKNGKYCYPLTITDNASRYILTCESLESTCEATAFPVFERAFKDYGVPDAIRTDNGVPFAHPRTIFNLSRLSVWWLRHGIKIERIEPGQPQQNGRHERMHRTLKDETTKPPANNILAQQEKFDLFLNYFNSDRPHQALNMKCPNDIYIKSKKIYSDIDILEYKSHDKTLNVSSSGSIKLNGESIFISEVLAYQQIGIKKIDDDILKVTFMDYDLGFFDEENYKLMLASNPFL